METETSTKLTGDKITRFVERLKKIGIDVKLSGNFPWVYIDEICGVRVTETFLANHGFTLIFLPGRNDSPVSEFTDIEVIFKLIRKYVKKAKWLQTEKLKAQIEVFEWLDSKDYLTDEVDILRKEFEQQLKKIKMIQNANSTRII